MLEQNLNPLSEVEAMSAIATALTKLDESSRRRVLLWASDVFDIKSNINPISRNSSFPIPEKLNTNIENTAEDLATFYSNARPKTDSEKTLVVSYWIQYKENQDSVDAQNVNTQLKHLGYGVGNITRAFMTLMGAKPTLMVQTRKSGTTKQARKTYKVTNEGKKFVENMINGNNE